MNPAQNAPLTRSPRGDDGDDGDGADSSAWFENKKEHAAMSSIAASRRRIRFRIARHSTAARKIGSAHNSPPEALPERLGDFALFDEDRGS